MLYFLFGNRGKKDKNKLTFTMNPNELEDLADFADALKGKFEVLVKELKLSKRDKRVTDVFAGFNVLCRKLGSMAKKST